MNLDALARAIADSLLRQHGGHISREAARNLMIEAVREYAKATSAKDAE